MYKGNKETLSLIEKLVCINKVSKTTTGGKKLSFAALVIVGDGKGRVGFGAGKAREIVDARNKAIESAKKSLLRVPLKESRTLHHDCEGKFGSGHVLLRVAVPGTGIIAGGPMRAIFECLGIKDIVSKSLGSNNPYNMIRATFEALRKMSSPKIVADRRSKPVSEIVKRRNVIIGTNHSDQGANTTEDLQAETDQTSTQEINNEQE